jgi:hypothetical protein
MALYQKINGAWQPVTRVYLKKNGIYRMVSDVYVKDHLSHTWKSSYHYDVIPPNPPEIDLAIVEDWVVIKNQKQLSTRYINVGVRLPGGSNDPDARLTRVLTTYAGAAPTSHEGATFTPTPDKQFSGEPWSEWRYNTYGPHKDTSVIAWKQWPVNAGAGTKIKGDTVYYFTGWSLDNENNWSVSTPASIKTAKDSIHMDTIVIKEARFQPNSSGSWNSSGFQTGNLIQANSPRSVGLFMYGNQFKDSIGKQGTPTIRAASILLTRLENDTGPANANLYLFWSAIASTSGLPAAGGSLGKTDITKIGTLAKGQSKWFDLPTKFNADLDKLIGSIGLDYKDPVFAAAQTGDFSTIQAVATNLRCGEVHAVWEEAL